MLNPAHDVSVSSLFGFADDDYSRCFDSSLSCKLASAPQGVTDCLSDSLDFELSQVGLIIDEKKHIKFDSSQMSFEFVGISKGKPVCLVCDFSGKDYVSRPLDFATMHGR